MDYGLGRKPFQPDERDYSIDRLQTMIAAETATPVSWSDTEILDQKDTSECAAFGPAGLLNTDDENHIDPHFTNADAHEYYLQIKILEGEPGKEDGAYIRDSLKVAKDNGWISAYARLKTMQEIEDWLSKHGPVLVGTNWLQDMFTPDPDGTVHATGALEGGHCWFHHGDDGGEYFLSVNSWGTAWAVGGLFRISKTDFAQLLAAAGEAWALVEAVPTPTPAPKPRKKCWLMRLLGF